MVHYHGCRLSGDRLTTIRAMRSKHAFVSYADSADIGIIAAFSAWKSGKPFDIAGYALFIEQWHRHPSFDWYAIPDVIDGSENDNRVMRAAWMNHCPEGAWNKGVPVWHMHESLEELEYLVKAYERIAIGSSGQYATIGNHDWWGRISEALDVICDNKGRPKTKLHGMRMLDPTIFSHIPFSSADSTNVARNCGIDKAWNGPYAPKTNESRAMVMMERIEAHCSAARWNRQTAGVQQNYDLFG